MPEFSLNIYKLTIRKKHGDHCLNISNTPNLLKLIGEKLLTEGNRTEEDTGLEVANKIASRNERAFENFNPNIKDEVLPVCEYRDGAPFYQYIFLGVQYGDFGTGAFIRDIVSGRVVYEQKPDEVPMRPFYAMIAYPYGQDIKDGIVLLQQISGIGVKSVFEPALKKSIGVISAEYSSFFAAIAPLDRVYRLMDSFPLDKFKMTKYYRKNNDSVNKVYSKKEIIFSELSNTFADILLPHLRIKAQNPKAKITGIAEIEAFDPDEVSVVFDKGNGKNVTVKLKNIENANYAEVIQNDELEFDDKGFPSPNSMENAMKSKAEEFIDLMSRVLIGVK